MNINKWVLSLEQCFLLCIVLIQERASKHQLPTKSTSKNKQAKTFSHLKSKLNQISVIALPD